MHKTYTILGGDLMDKIYLLGDSITEWNIISHSDITKYAKAGWTTKNLLENFPSLENNSLVFLLIGVNDLNYGISTNEIIENFKIINEKLKHTKLKVFSILPSRDLALNEKIIKLNSELKEIFSNFIDIYDLFLLNNRLSDEYSVDNLHLNAQGYIILNSSLAKEIYKFRKPQDVKERFLEYIKWHTTSNSKSKTYPSTIEQRWFASFLEEELKTIGLQEVSIDQYGYLTATLEGDSSLPVIAFISHMDTAPDYSGKNCRPKIWKNYEGGNLVLAEDTILKPEDFPSLKNYIGQELITTSGNSLLGADDKAGIAEIISAMDFLIKNPHIKHGKVKIAFTPDEEIGAGTDYFDVKSFGAQYAYTLDGGEIGELEFENFNAATLKLKVTGISVHPGSAKNTLVHAGQLLFEFNSMLPVNQRPEFTEAYEGFFMITNINGGIEEGEISYIIRDHSRELFEEKKELCRNIVKLMESKYPRAKFQLSMEDSYYNMKEKIESCMFLVDIAKTVMEEIQIKPIIKTVRGGTDGARLSFMGLPCPNIFTGGHNFHGKYEYIPTNSMEKAVEVIVGIVKKFATEKYL